MEDTRDKRRAAIEQRLRAEFDETLDDQVVAALEATHPDWLEKAAEEIEERLRAEFEEEIEDRVTDAVDKMREDWEQQASEEIERLIDEFEDKIGDLIEDELEREDA
jgi:hypothetical protein